MNLHDEIVQSFAEGCARSCEALAERMLRDGQTPEAGWTIGQRTWTEGRFLKFECWPIAPKLVAPRQLSNLTTFSS